MNDNNQGTSLEIADVEHFKSSGDDVFNYEFLVMKAISKCIESGSHEMRTGWFNSKIDNSGNAVRSYIEDTRKKYIETIKTLYGLLVRIFDETAETDTNKLKGDLGEEKKVLLDDQWKWYNELPPNPKESFKGEIIKGAFSTNLGWYQQYIELELECYREIFIKLMELIKRRDDFKVADFEA